MEYFYSVTRTYLYSFIVQPPSEEEKEFEEQTRRLLKARKMFAQVTGREPGREDAPKVEAGPKKPGELKKAKTVRLQIGDLPVPVKPAKKVGAAMLASSKVTQP